MQNFVIKLFCNCECSSVAKVQLLLPRAIKYQKHKINAKTQLRQFPLPEREAITGPTRNTNILFNQTHNTTTQQEPGSDANLSGASGQLLSPLRPRPQVRQLCGYQSFISVRAELECGAGGRGLSSRVAEQSRCWPSDLRLLRHLIENVI